MSCEQHVVVGIGAERYEWVELAGSVTVPENHPDVWPAQIMIDREFERTLDERPWSNLYGMDRLLEYFAGESCPTAPRAPKKADVPWCERSHTPRGKPTVHEGPAHGLRPNAEPVMSTIAWRDRDA
jgi:hypothetical protein